MLLCPAGALLPPGCPLPLLAVSPAWPDSAGFWLPDSLELLLEELLLGELLLEELLLLLEGGEEEGMEGIELGTDGGWGTVGLLALGQPLNNMQI